MSDSPKMNLPDNIGNVGDVMGDCHRCGAYRCWGPPRKSIEDSFVCNKCISGCGLSVHAHTDAFDGDVRGCCPKCGKAGYGKPVSEDGPFICNKCANRTSSTQNTVLICEGCKCAAPSLTTTSVGAGKMPMELCKNCLDVKQWCDSVDDLARSKSTQVGGTHYTKLAIDPYEYAHRNGLGMLQGNVVKYVTRYKDKNGKEDLEKAINTLKRLIDMEYPK